MRGQSALEYAIMVGIALMILIPLWVSIHNSVTVTRSGLQSSYALNAVSRLKSAADAVYVQGEPAKFTVIITMPDGVESVGISSNEIFVRLSGEAGTSDAIATTLGPVTGNLSSSPGTHRVTVRMNDTNILITEGE